MQAKIFSLLSLPEITSYVIGEIFEFRATCPTHHTKRQITILFSVMARVLFQRLELSFLIKNSDISWHLPFLSKPGWITRLHVCHLRAMHSSDSPLGRHLLTSLQPALQLDTLWVTHIRLNYRYLAPTTYLKVKRQLMKLIPVVFPAFLMN